MSTQFPTKECAVQWESQVNGYENLGSNDIVHFISNGLVVAWIDFDGNAGGNLSSINFNGMTDTSANAGTNGDVPAQVAGYLIFDLGATTVKVPYYNS